MIDNAGWLSGLFCKTSNVIVVTFMQTMLNGFDIL